MTVTEVRDLFRQYIDEPDQTFITDAMVGAMLSRAYDEFRWGVLEFDDTVYTYEVTITPTEIGNAVIVLSSVWGVPSSTPPVVAITDDKGHLTIDSAELDEVMTSDFTTVSQLFASDSGLANSLDVLLERYVASDGILTSRTDGIKTSIDSITEDRERLTNRLIAVEARYRAQFTAMDLLVGQLQALGGFLSQQLASLPKPNSIGNN